jgi:hypothetical protein
MPQPGNSRQKTSSLLVSCLSGIFAYCPVSCKITVSCILWTFLLVSRSRRNSVPVSPNIVRVILAKPCTR